MDNVAESLAEFLDGLGCAADDCDDEDDTDDGDDGDDGDCCIVVDDVGVDSDTVPGPAIAMPPDLSWSRQEATTKMGTVAPGSEVYYLLHCDGGVTRPPEPCNVSVSDALNVGPASATAVAADVVFSAIIIAALCMVPPCICCKCADSDRCFTGGCVSAICFTLVQFMLAMLPVITSIAFALVQHPSAVALLVVYSGGLVLVVTLAGCHFGLTLRAAPSHSAAGASGRPSGSPRGLGKPLTRHEALERVEAWDGGEWGEGALESTRMCLCCLPVYREARATCGALTVVWVAFVVDNLVRPALLVMFYT